MWTGRLLGTVCHMPLGDGAKFAGYTIERRLGAGGMGEVYLAQHPRLPRHDAIKVLKAGISSDPDYIERFNREADLASKLWHPHIVGILDRGKYRGRLWISMDFVDGTDVSRLLQDHPDGMPVDEALEIVRAVASALDYSHSKGLLHRDVKPANILIADVEHGERRILLGDFGVARDLSDGTSGGLTATNMTVGTAAYAAPEQLMGLSLDGTADQYSLAADRLSPADRQAAVPGVEPGRRHRQAPQRRSHRRWVGPNSPRWTRCCPERSPRDPKDRFATCTDFVGPRWKRPSKRPTIPRRRRPSTPPTPCRRRWRHPSPVHRNHRYDVAAAGWSP